MRTSMEERSVPEESDLGSSAELTREYHEQKNVNGTTISVGWDKGYENFTIYFPQIELGTDEDVWDQVIILDERPAEAKRVFDYAVQLAERETNVYNIFKKVSAFAKSLLDH